MSAATPLKQLRLKRQLTVTEVARIVGVSKSAVHYWEQGEKEPGPENRVKYAGALKITPGRLGELIYGGEA